MSPKMKLAAILTVIFSCTVLPVVAMFAYEAYRSRDLTAEIIARAPERGNFKPRELAVPAGRNVKLRVRNVDTVEHGFTIPALGVDAGVIKAGHVAVLEFEPEDVGTYDYYCTVWCSPYHLQMRGKLHVKEEVDSR